MTDDHVIAFDPPADRSLLSQLDGTVIVPNADRELPRELVSTIVSRVDDRGGSVEFDGPLLESKDGYFELDLKAFAHLLWEHRQYSAAQRFSPRHMDILRTIQQIAQDDEKILNSEVQAYSSYNDNTVNNAMRTLTEMGLLSQVTRGAYRYNGFQGWTPPDEEDSDG